jgi:hypothetical protein
MEDGEEWLEKKPREQLKRLWPEPRPEIYGGRVDGEKLDLMC